MKKKVIKEIEQKNKENKIKKGICVCNCVCNKPNIKMYKTPNVLKAIMRGTLSLQDDEKVMNGEVFARRCICECACGASKYNNEYIRKKKIREAREKKQKEIKETKEKIKELKQKEELRKIKKIQKEKEHKKWLLECKVAQENKKSNVYKVEFCCKDDNDKDENNNNNISNGGGGVEEVVDDKDNDDKDEDEDEDEELMIMNRVRHQIIMKK